MKRMLRHKCRSLVVGSLIASVAMTGSVVGVAHAITSPQAVRSPKAGPPAPPATTPVPIPDPNPGHKQLPTPIPLPGGGG